MTRPVAFGLNVDPNTGGLAIAARIAAIEGITGPRRTVAEARQALSEAVDIIRASWTGEPFQYAGQHYQVPDAQPGPRPAHDVGIWLGVVGSRAVRLAGAKADGWSVSAPYVPPPRLAELGDILTESAREAGRDPDRIVRLYHVMGLITPESQDTFHGPKERWVDTLTALYSDFGMRAAGS